MALVRCEGIVLKTHALGDTSLIVVTYTREHGLLKLVAKAARRAPSRFGYALEPLSRSRFVVYHKPDRDLHLVSQAEVLEPTGSGLTDLTRLAHGQAALELIDRLVWGEEPHAELFDLLAAALQAVSRAPVGTLAAVTIGFELQVASLLGYRPRLDACANCGGSISPRRLFSPSRGGLLCDGCAAAEPGAVTLSADALAGLALLLSRPLREAGDWLQFTEVRRTGEIMRVVESFLRHHFQRFQGLRSLEMLRSLPGAEPGPEPGPNIRPNLGKDTPCPT